MTFTVQQVCADSFGEPANNSGWFDGEWYKGRYLVCARGTSGLSVVDFLDPANPVESDSIQVSFAQATYGRSMGVCVIGDMAYLACRQGSGSGKGFGIIEEFDISDPTNVVATGNIYDPLSSTATLLDLDPPNVYTYLFSDLATDGTYLFAAGQRSGFYKFDPTNLALGPVDGIEDETGSDPIETQGVAYDENTDTVVFANYRYGVRILDRESWGGVVDASLPQYNTGTELLRPWQVVCRGGWAFFCVNVDANHNSDERGLLTLDLRGDLSQLTSDDWNYFQIPVAFNEALWTQQDNGGDAPQNDISVLGNRCYISNGQNGVIWFDITDPANAVWGGQFGTPAAGDNLYMTKAARIGGRELIVYGDGFQASNSGSKTLYCAEVTEVPVILGNASEPDGAGASYLSSTQPRGPNAAYDLVAERGDYLDRLRIAVHSLGGPRIAVIGIYNRDIGSLIHLETLAVTAGGYPHSGVLILPFASRFYLNEGVKYSFRVLEGGGQNIQMDHNYNETALPMAQHTPVTATPPDMDVELPSEGDYTTDGVIALLGGNARSGGGGRGGINGSITGKVAS